MSFKPTDMINLENYEEYFVLYTDGELTPQQVQAVEAFVAAHPHLADELQLLQSTKLTADDTVFAGKENLLAPAMKANLAEEELLLYLDAELPPAQAAIVAHRLTTDSDYAAQFALLRQTKLDASEAVVYPDKKNLYRYEERVSLLRPWMRIAAAVLLLLLGGWFFLLNRSGQPQPLTVGNSRPATQSPSLPKQNPEAQPSVVPLQNQAQKTEMVARQNSPATQPAGSVLTRTGKVQVMKNGVQPQAPLLHQLRETTVGTDVPAKRTVSPLLTTERPALHLNDVALNKTIIRDDVTSSLLPRNTDEVSLEAADAGGDFTNTKRSSAKGLFRKVTRFIGRNTGIGIASADNDNEVLIGALAIKRN